MPFTTDYPAAALRHLADAEALEHDSRFPCAGYHYGFAAECAMKEALQRAGVPSLRIPFDDDPMWKHLGPHQKNLSQKILLLARGGRLAVLLTNVLSFASNATFMQGWEIKMRYAPDTEVTQADCTRWSADAVRAVFALL